MPLETGTVIENLDKLSPLNSDPVLQGDDHLRLIKAILQSQFPGALGDGFAIPITATEVEINYLSGLTGNVQAQLDAIVAVDALVAPSGTTMMFFQSSPPVGWTQLAANNDSMLRAVSDSSGGTVGGSDSPITLTIDHIHTTQDHVLTESEMPPHIHRIGKVDPSSGSTSGIDHVGKGLTGGTPENSASAGGGAAHGHGDTGQYQQTFTPRYVNIMTAVKD